MTVTNTFFKQLDALEELRDAWRATKHDAYFAQPDTSPEQAAGAKAGYLAYCFAARVLELGGWPSDITDRLDGEAERARRDGLPDDDPALVAAYADVLHGFADAVRAIK